jgi:hypothetical protein
MQVGEGGSCITNGVLINAYEILVRIPETKSNIERSRHRQENNIKRAESGYVSHVNF